MDKKILDDMGLAAAAVTLVNPLGAVGAVAGATSVAASIGSGVVEGQAGKAVGKEVTQALAQEYMQYVYKLPAAAATRITALIDLVGGWDAFADRVQKEVVSSKDKK